MNKYNTEKIIKDKAEDYDKLKAASKFIFWLGLSLFFQVISYYLFAFGKDTVARWAYRASYAPRTLLLFNMIEDDSLPFSSKERILSCVLLLFSNIIAAHIIHIGIDWGIIVELILFALALLFERSMIQKYIDSGLSIQEYKKKLRIIVIAAFSVYTLLMIFVIYLIYKWGIVF